MNGPRNLVLLAAICCQCFTSAGNTQPAGKGPLVAYLTPGYLTPGSPQGEYTKSFVEAMRALGYVENKNIRYDFRGAMGDASRIAPLAREIIAARPDVVVATDAGLYTHSSVIVRDAARLQLPAVYPIGERCVSEGGLASYGPSSHEIYRRAASYVDRILKGAKPGELPMEQPTTFELALNRKTAAMLGVKIPQSLLLRADRVIE